jgi:DNA-binding response OmpR family regulator
MYQQFLKARGYVVSVASDGEDAVYRALNGAFDLVVLDVGLRPQPTASVQRRSCSQQS